MAMRTINSPGVEIGERDLSLRVPTRAGTHVYVTGFSKQGPADEVISVSSYTEFEQTYGNPTTPAERYFAHTVKAALDSTARVKVNRLPYGGGSGRGFGSYYSVLAYPALVYGSNGVSLTAGGRGFYDAADARSYILGAPTQFAITEEEYQGLKTGSIFPGGRWSRFCTGGTNFSGLSDLAGAAVIVINTAQTVIDNNYAGYYLGLKDNTDLNPATDFTSIRNVETTYQQPDRDGIKPLDYIVLPSTRLSFGLTATNAEGIDPKIDSISQIMEQKVAGPQFESGLYRDTLNLGVFKLRPSIFGKDTTELDYVLEESFNGSIGYYRKQTSPNGGAPVNFFLENVENTSRNIQVLVNPYVSDYFKGLQVDRNGVPRKRIRLYSKKLVDGVANVNRVYNNSLIYNTDIFNSSPPTTFTALTGRIATYNNKTWRMAKFNAATQIPAASAAAARTNFEGISTSLFNFISATNVTAIRSLTGHYDNWGINFTNLQALTALGAFEVCDSLFPLGSYADALTEEKLIGNLPAKITRALDAIKNDEVHDIDIIAEGGLGTIWTTMCSSQLPYFDDTFTNETIDAIRTTDPDLDDTSVVDYYTTIANQFIKFCGPPKDGGRGDVLFIADPLRQIFVTGKQSKVLDDKSKNFSRDIFWALRHQFSNINTSYATVFANYLKVYDETSGLYMYAPPSGFIAAKMASTDADIGPWGAPAGFNRGIINNAVDLAISPNQRQRDELYHYRFNPIAKFPDQGLVVFGQKTLLNQPSAFDRINVRRTFLYLEKIVKSVMKFFLFENNTVFTRTRIINTLTPFFQRIKAADGLYDFLIVCDERNNTPEVIDNNELIVDIYLKPVRTAEFILVNFYATRTDASFEELIGG
jgi:hypothetical protein